MYQLPILPVFLVSFFLFTLVIFYLLYRRTTHGHGEGSSEEIYKNRSKIIEEAHEKANKILTDAENRANEIIYKSEYIKTDFVKNLEGSLATLEDSALKVFKDTSAEFYTKYKEVLDRENADNLSKIHETLESIKKISESQLEEFSKSLKKESLDSQVFISTKIQEQLDQVNKEIDEYKKKHMGIINSSINTIVEKVAERAIGRSLQIEDHEKLVLEAFDEAKKDTALFSVKDALK